MYVKSVANNSNKILLMFLQDAALHLLLPVLYILQWQKPFAEIGMPCFYLVLFHSSLHFFSTRSFAKKCLCCAVYFPNISRFILLQDTLPYAIHTEESHW